MVDFSDLQKKTSAERLLFQAEIEDLNEQLEACRLHQDQSQQ